MLVALACATLAAPAHAQGTPPAPPARAPSDTDSLAHAPPALGINGLLLRPQHLRYEMVTAVHDTAHVVGTRDVDLRSGSYGAFPAWIVSDVRGGRVPGADSVYFSTVDFRPLHWSSVLGDARLALEFTPDSIYGGTSGPTGNQNIALGNRGDLLANGTMVNLALELLPLTVGWQDSVSVLLVDLGTARIVPAVLTVDGEEDIAGPGGGRVHCRVVTLQAGTISARYWVSTVNPTVVRMRQELPDRPGEVFEQRLLSRN
jgi:hypothetical protein